MEAAGKSFSRENNRRLVLKVVYEGSPLSRTQITERTNLNKVSVTRVVDRLIKEGLVREGEQSEVGRGRPQTLLRLVSDSRYAVGVDIGISEVKLGICDLKGKVIFELKKKNEGAGLIDLLVESIRELIKLSGIPTIRILGVGISMPGVIDVERGIVKSSFILKERDTPLKGGLENGLKMKVVLDRDANAGLFYERFLGKGRDMDDILYIYTRNNEEGEMGVGCSFFLNGHVYRGTDYCAGEIGLAHSESGGESITEPFSSYEAISFRDNAYAANNGDTQAGAILAEVGDKIGRGIAFLINLLNPRLVVIGGDFSLAGESFLRPVRESLRRHVFDFSNKDIRIESSSVDEYAGVRAAAFMVIAKFVGYS